MLVKCNLETERMDYCYKINIYQCDKVKRTPKRRIDIKNRDFWNVYVIFLLGEGGSMTVVFPI